MRFSTLLFAAAAATLSLAAPVARDTTDCTIVANHTVVSGDTLGAIANNTGTSVAQLQYVNPQITNINFINLGDIIAIPSPACEVPTTTTTTPTAEITATCVDATTGGVDGAGKDGTYTVVGGDTLTIIANEKLGITLPALVVANPQIENVNVINVGDVINVPLCT